MSFGLKALYYKSKSSNPASVGTLRLASADPGVAFRNNANSGDLVLTTNTSDQLLFNGTPIGGSGIYTANRAIISDGSGNLTVSPTTAAELAFVSGVTSAIQTQLNTKIDTAGTGLSKSGTTLNLVTPVIVANGGTGDTSLTAYSVLCGGTTSTNPIQSVASIGASGQVLTSNGAGVLPTFQNVSGGGTVNSGIAGRLSLYPTSTNTVADTYVQNTKNIVLAIATQASRSVDLTLTIPNPGNSTGAANVLLSEGAQTINGAQTFGAEATFTNDIVFTGNNSGTVITTNQNSASDLVIRLANTNTSGGGSNNILTVSSSTGGDPYTTYNNPTFSWSSGSDNSDSDKYKISQNQTLGTNDYLIIDGTTTAVTIHGTNTNDSASTGYVGEYISSYISTGSAVSAGPSVDYKNITSISLTAGDWDVTGIIGLSLSGATVTRASGAVSLFSGNTTTDQQQGDNDNNGPLPTTVANSEAIIPAWRVSVSTTTTVYLKFSYIYSAGTPVAFGRISARRVR